MSRDTLPRGVCGCIPARRPALFPGRGPSAIDFPVHAQNAKAGFAVPPALVARESDRDFQEWQKSAWPEFQPASLPPPRKGKHKTAASFLPGFPFGKSGGFFLFFWAAI